MSGFKADTDHFVKGFAPVQIDGGFRIKNGDFAATLAATYSPGLIATMNLGFGFAY